MKTNSCPNCDRPLPEEDMLDENSHPVPTNESDGCTCERCIAACWAAAWNEECMEFPKDWRKEAQDLKEKLNIAVAALQDILDISRDRQKFVMMGPRAFVKAEQIALEAVEQIE